MQMNEYYPRGFRPKRGTKEWEASSETHPGRHFEMMEEMEKRAAAWKGGRVVALVVGVGGAPRNIAGADPTEHVEVAKALKRAGVDYEVHAFEIDDEAVEAAKRVLKKGAGIPHIIKKIEAAQAPARSRLYQAYLGKIAASKGGKQRIEVDAQTAGRITVYGPGAEGDVLNATPSKKPHFIFCLNTAEHYDHDGQFKLAEKLASLAGKGCSIMAGYTSQENEQGVFFFALENLGLKKEEIEVPGQPNAPKMLVFTRTH